MTEKKFVKVKAVCLGSCWLADEKIGTKIAFLDKDGNLDGTTFTIKRHRSIYPGVVYELEATEDLQTIKVGFEHVEAWPNEKERAAWRVTSDAIETSYRAKKETREKVGGLASVRQLLAPLRAAYRDTDSTGRRAIEVILLEAVRS